MKARILAACVSIAGLSAGPALASEIWWKPYTSDANTLGLWHFNDVTSPSGSFADSGPGSNNGALTVNSVQPAGDPLPPPVNVTLTTTGVSGAGGGTVGAGTFGKSLNFSPSQLPLPGDASALNWGSVQDDNTDMETGAEPIQMTIEAWVRPSTHDVNASEVYFVGKRADGASWNFGMVGGELFFDANFSGGYANIQAPSALTANTWHHVAAVFIENEIASDDRVHLYVDGAQVADGGYDAEGFNGTILQNSDPLILGNRGTSTADTVYNGDLDEVRYSNIARTFGAAEVPEPASMALFCAAGAMALVRRRRR